MTDSKLIISTLTDIKKLLEGQAQKQDENIIDTKEIAEWLGVSSEAIKNYRTNLNMPFKKLGGKVIFFKSDVLVWINGLQSSNKKAKFSF